MPDIRFDHGLLPNPIPYLITTSSHFPIFVGAMQTYPNLLIVSGTGRKSGKTTLACQIIKAFRNENPVGIKISPHFHEPSEGLQLIVNNVDFRIFREESARSGKDSSRMLTEGAAEAYYIQVSDHNLEKSFTWIYNLIGPSMPVVCESPALRRYFKPGVFLIVDSDSITNKKNLKDIEPLADRIVVQDLFIETVRSIKYSDKKWLID